MLAILKSCTISGYQGVLTQVEVDVTRGFPHFDIVGLADTAVKESRERVRAALGNNGFKLPADRITVNLAPAAIQKHGPVLDVPIALGILAASGQIPASPRLLDTLSASCNGGTYSRWSRCFFHSYIIAPPKTGLVQMPF